MSAEKHRHPSPLQRRGLIVLVALNAKRPGPVVTRDIERVLERGCPGVRPQPACLLPAYGSGRLAAYPPGT